MKDFQADFCYTSAEIPGICAQFSLKSDHLLLEGAGVKKGPKEISLPDSLKLTAGWLISLAENKKVKLSVAEALLLEKAVPAWSSEKRFIGMSVTPSGLAYKITEAGTGIQAGSGKKVYVHYRGTLLDGSEFDNSFKRGQPLPFTIGTGQVIKGWDEGIALLREGGKAILKVPPELGYGARGYPPVIPGNATLVFEVELVKVE